MDWRLLGVPIDSSGRGRGEERAPAALRAAAIAERLGVVDGGDVDAAMHDPVRDPETGMIGFESVVRASAAIRAAVRDTLAAGERPLLIGGDCTLLPGAIAGARDALGPLALAYLDGHLDYHDGRSSQTGEAADMPLAILRGRGPRELTGEAPLVEAADVVVIGERDRADRERLRDVPENERVRTVPGESLGSGGAAQVGRWAAELLAARDRPLWLHWDLDVLDEADFPAVTYPQPRGPHWRDMPALLEPLLRSPRLVGIDVTDLDADRDPDGRHATAIVACLEQLLARAVPGGRRAPAPMGRRRSPPARSPRRS